MNSLHSLEIIHGETPHEFTLRLDGFEIKGVQEYKIEATVNEAMVLSLKLIVKSLKLLTD